ADKGQAVAFPTMRLFRLGLIFSSFLVLIEGRTFSIDYANNRFLKDGQPFRYIAGSVHYFRTHPAQWNDRLTAVRAAGLNAITTYIPWNFHETFEKQYNFSGWRDIGKFFELAAANELAVILRPGPYICAEWENGGLPYWLLKTPNIGLRSSQPDFLNAALGWWDVLLPKVEPYLWKNGGPVIMVQVENEYGSFGCDAAYRDALRDKAIQKLGADTVLFTTDPPEFIKCGAIDGVYATVDFGQRGLLLMDEYFSIQRKHNPQGGPRVNSEYYPGWYSTWGGAALPNQQSSPESVLEMTEKMFARNASFNYYMFHGGTNFEFWNGAEYDAGLVTSYDYSAPLTEAGAANEKYKKVADFISKIPGWPNPPSPTPRPSPSFAMPSISLKRMGNINEYLKNGMLFTASRVQTSNQPTNFENLDQPFGFVMYETTVTAAQVASISGNFFNGSMVRDFGYVYINETYKFTLSTHFKPNTVTSGRLTVSAGDVIRILVESQGRLTWETIKDFKGIIGTPTLGGVPLLNWKQTPIDIEKISEGRAPPPSLTGFRPADVFYGEVALGTRIADTYIDMSSWGKGVVFINGFNIGRYWSTHGPQKALYVPLPLLKPSDSNTIAVFELEKLSSDCLATGTYCTINLINHPIL
ncbi:unnamed protein product, partial [Caenorhabditis auriculariae]